VCKSCVLTTKPRLLPYLPSSIDNTKKPKRNVELGDWSEDKDKIDIFKNIEVGLLRVTYNVSRESVSYSKTAHTLYMLGQLSMKFGCNLSVLVCHQDYSNH